MHSDVNNENYSISGNLSETGDLNAKVGFPSSGGDFRGTLGTDKKGSGSWANSLPTPAKSGSWKGEKNKIKSLHYTMQTFFYMNPIWVISSFSFSTTNT